MFISEGCGASAARFAPLKTRYLRHAAAALQTRSFCRRRLEMFYIFFYQLPVLAKPRTTAPTAPNHPISSGKARLAATLASLRAKKKKKKISVKQSDGSPRCFPPVAVG